MAVRYFGIDKGQAQKTNVQEDSSTNSTDFELAIDLDAEASKQDVLIGIEAIKQAIVESNWPPA